MEHDDPYYDHRTESQIKNEVTKLLESMRRMLSTIDGNMKRDAGM